MDIKNIKDIFPTFANNPHGKKLAFLGNGSTSLKPQMVIDAIVEYYTKFPGNLNGQYEISKDITHVFREAKKELAQHINAGEKEIVFTSSTTDSLNDIAKLLGQKLSAGDEIVINEIEHGSNVVPWLEIAKATGAKIVWALPNEHEIITLDSYKNAIGPKTKIVSVAHVSNVLGDKRPVKEIGKIAKEVGAYFIVDGAQGLPHYKIDVKDIDCDFYTAGAYKFYGPTGIGFYYAKYEVLESVEPVNFGGKMSIAWGQNQESQWNSIPDRFEAGTKPMGEVVGLRAAIKFLQKVGMENIAKHELEMKQYALSRLSEVPNIIIHNKEVSDGTKVVFNFPHTDANEVTKYLNTKGIYLDSGFHCARRLLKDHNYRANCRLAVAIYTTKEDIDNVYDALMEAKFK